MMTAGPSSRPGTDEPILHAALNGDRRHSATPRTLDDRAAQAKATVAAGAQVVHVHLVDEEGRQTFAASASARRSCSLGEAPATPVG